MQLSGWFSARLRNRRCGYKCARACARCGPPPAPAPPTDWHRPMRAPANSTPPPNECSSESPPDDSARAESPTPASQQFLPCLLLGCHRDAKVPTDVDSFPLRRTASRRRGRRGSASSRRAWRHDIVPRRRANRTWDRRGSAWPTRRCTPCHSRKRQRRAPALSRWRHAPARSGLRWRDRCNSDLRLRRCPKKPSPASGRVRQRAGRSAQPRRD